MHLFAILFSFILIYTHDVFLQLKMINPRNQGRINQANARGLAFLGASRLEYQNTPLLVFHVFRLFTTRQNCRSFWLLRLVYRLRKLTTLVFTVFEWLERTEPNGTTLYDPRIRLKSGSASISVRRNFSRTQRQNFTYPLQVADDAMQMDVHKTLYRFYSISLCRLNLKSQSFVWNLFCTSAIRYAFSFHKLPNIIFWALSTNKSYFKNNQRPEQHNRGKNKKFRHSRKTLSSNEK